MIGLCETTQSQSQVVAMTKPRPSYKSHLGKNNFASPVKTTLLRVATAVIGWRRTFADRRPVTRRFCSSYLSHLYSLASPFHLPLSSLLQPPAGNKRYQSSRRFPEVQTLQKQRLSLSLEDVAGIQSNRCTENSFVRPPHCLSKRPLPHPDLGRDSS